MIELMIAAAILSISALAFVNAIATSSKASLESDRALQTKSALQSSYESLADVQYDQLLSWNGVVTAYGDDRVTVTANLVQVGLIEVDFIVTDERTGEILARLATYRSG